MYEWDLRFCQDGPTGSAPWPEAVGFIAGAGPGTDQATAFGPFFVLPFNTTVVTP